MANGAAVSEWYEYKNRWTQKGGAVIEEILLSIYVNAMELANIMTTPLDQDALALGFLKNEGFIRGLDEVEILTVGRNGCCVDIWLNRPVEKPQRVVITSGCGGGVTFDDPSMGVEPLEDDFQIEPERLFELIGQIHHRESLHARSRGVHAAGLSDGREVLAIAEDVGRHNTIDKLAGACLLRGFDSKGKIILATGRVSSEMLHKGALMGCPIIASRNSPTSLSVAMARAWNITLVGYLRENSMRVYSHPERLGHKENQRTPVSVR